MKYLFIDESGDHNLLPEKIDPQFPLFILTGIVFDRKEYKKFKKEVLKFKKHSFGKEKVVLHSNELTRPNITKQKELGALTNREKRKDFYVGLNQLLSRSNFSIFAFVIDKPWFAKTFGSTPPDPYFLSFIDLFSKFEELLGKKEYGEIFVENRNPILDKQFILAWESAKVSKVSQAMDSEKLKKHNISKPAILPKSWDQSGLELADLISYRLARHFMKKPEKVFGNEIALEVVNSKKISIGSFTNLPNANLKENH